LEFIERIDICIKTHAKASLEYDTDLNPIYYNPLFEAGNKGSEFENSGNKIN
jgi:hypothetical protein